MLLALVTALVAQLRQQIAFIFWPDSTEAQAFTNLRKLFFDLRQALPHANGSRQFLAAKLLKLWLVVERFEMGRSAGLI